MLAWRGSEGLDEFDTRVSNKCIQGRGIAHVPGMIQKFHGGEDGFNVVKLRERLPAIHKESEGFFMPVSNQMVEEQTAETRKTVDLYIAAVKTFRNEIKNDLSSVRAASSTIEEVCRKMGKTYSDTAAMLNSPEFITAIANAERLAAALQAISQVESNKITFAVLSK